MRRTLLALLAIMLLAGSTAAQELSYLSKLPPIIDRDVFFGDPEIAAVQDLARREAYLVSQDIQGPA